jgi:Flp pilus assembly protein TadD
MSTAEQAFDSLYATGHWLLQQDRFADAADVFRAMASLNAEDERAWLGLGQAHEGAKHHVIAKEMYVTGVTLARSGRCAIALARLLREFGRDAQASDCIDYADEVARAHDDEALAALVAYERGTL